MSKVPDTIMINIALGNREYTEDQERLFYPVLSRRAEISLTSDSSPDSVGEECIRMIEDILEKFLTDLARPDKGEH